MAEVAIALGSNLGDRLASLRAAYQQLAELVLNRRASSIYESDPAGDPRQPRYLNAVVVGTTPLTPLDLLQALLRIEAQFGRTRPFPNAPRTIDLDLLLHDDLVLETPTLTLPHPRLHERFFVLVPLAELASGLRHPVFDQTIAELLRALGPPTGIERIADDAALDEQLAPP
jgi:2-amino-4-hydroxy-6-hydroxymethyldihydropteridine diphosphokinase